MTAMTKVVLICAALMTGVFLNARESHAGGSDEVGTVSDQAAPSDPAAMPKQDVKTGDVTGTDDGNDAVQMTCDIPTCDGSCYSRGFCYGICETGAGCKCYDYHDPNC